MNTSTDPRSTPATSSRQRVGLVLAMLLSLANIVSVASPTPDGEVGPPIGVLVLGAVLGLLGIGGALLAWRTGNRMALRVTAGAVIVMALLAVPAFFVDVPSGLKAVVGAVVLVSLASVVLIFSMPRQES